MQAALKGVPAEPLAQGLLGAKRDNTFPRTGKKLGQNLCSFKIRTACSYCLVGNTKWSMGVQELTSSALFLKPSSSAIPCEQQQKTFALLSMLELPYGSVWILSQHYTLPPWTLQLFRPRPWAKCLPQEGPLRAFLC